MVGRWSPGLGRVRVGSFLLVGLPGVSSGDSCAARVPRHARRGGRRRWWSARCPRRHPPPAPRVATRRIADAPSLSLVTDVPGRRIELSSTRIRSDAEQRTSFGIQHHQVLFKATWPTHIIHTKTHNAHKHTKSTEST